MKDFSIRTLAFASLVLLSACSAQQASVTNADWTMDEEAVSSPSGPYLEMDEDDEDTVELHINQSGSAIQ